MKRKCSVASATFIAVLLISTSCFAPALGSNRSVKTDEVINLGRLQSTQYSSPFGGNFLQLANGLVLFFTWDDFHAFRAVLEQSAAEKHFKLLSYDPKTKSKRWITVTVSSSDGLLYFNGLALTPETVDRLRLSRRWSKVLHNDWSRQCSICDLHNGRFFISGGYPSSEYRSPPRFTAVVYDADKEKIIATFMLAGIHSSHTSLFLGEGRVLLAGGLMGNLEIVDVNAEATVYYQPSIGVKFCAACLADQNTVLLIGGMREEYTSKMVSAFDCTSHSLVEIGSKKLDQAFGGMDNRTAKSPETMEFTIDSSAQPIGNGRFLVSGGGYIRPTPFADFYSNEHHKAEIFRICAPRDKGATK